MQPLPPCDAYPLVPQMLIQRVQKPITLPYCSIGPLTDPHPPQTVLPGSQPSAPLFNFCLVGLERRRYCRRGELHARYACCLQDALLHWQQPLALLGNEVADALGHLPFDHLHTALERPPFLTLSKHSL